LSIRGRLLTIVLAAFLPLPLFALFFARESFTVFVLAGLAAGFCAAVTALRASHNIGGRLQALGEAAHRIREGDFTTRVPVRKENGADGELSALKRNFNLKQSDRKLGKIHTWSGCALASA
jgi:HAMP domain-containing protein